MLRANMMHKGKGIKSSIVIDSNVIIDTFDPNSCNYDASYSFMDHIVAEKILFAMPMHGWFEIFCTLNRIEKEKGTLPPIFGGQQQMAIEFIHIDDQFLKNYSKVAVPIIKAMDHIFLVVAKKNSLPLITWDVQMAKAGEKCGVKMFTPEDWMQKM